MVESRHTLFGGLVSLWITVWWIHAQQRIEEDVASKHAPVASARKRNWVHRQKWKVKNQAGKWRIETVHCVPHEPLMPPPRSTDSARFESLAGMDLSN